MELKINVELIAQCLSNDRKAQRLLYNMLLPYFNAISQRYLKNDSDKKDVLQETFINIFKKLHQFDAARASFKTWATKILINNCLKKNQQYKKAPTQELIVELHDYHLAADSIDDLSDSELLRWVKKMPQQYYEVFNLFIVEGFSHAEIAKMLEIEEALSRQRLSRARAWLKKKLTDKKTNPQPKRSFSSFFK